METAALTYRYVDKLAKRGAYVPHVVLAGGFSLEDHVFKALNAVRVQSRVWNKLSPAVGATGATT